MTVRVRGVVLTDVCAVSFEITSREWMMQPGIPGGCLDWVATALDGHIATRGLNQFAALLPSLSDSAMVEDHASNLALRVTRHYDATTDRFRYRADMLGGTA